MDKTFGFPIINKFSKCWRCEKMAYHYDKFESPKEITCYECHEHELDEQSMDIESDDEYRLQQEREAEVESEVKD